MSTATFYFTAAILPTLDMHSPSSPCNSKTLLHDPLHPHLLTVGGDDLAISRKLPSLNLINFFARPSTRTSSDASTPSASSSPSSPTSSFLIDDDPFAKVDSPPLTSSLDFIGLDSPSPTSSTKEFIYVPTPPRSPLAPRQSVLQSHSPGNQHPPVSLRVKHQKRVRITPSLPSLHDLACADASSYASVIVRTRASKRFPLEPWNLPQATQTDENYSLTSPSQFATIKRKTPLDNISVLRTSSNPDSAPIETRKTRSNLVLEPRILSSDSDGLHPCKNHASSCSKETSLHPASGLHRECPHEPNWWDIVHDSKDATECDDDPEAEIMEPEERQPCCPPILEATWQQGNGYRDSVERGGAGEEDNTSSEYGSDGYGNDSPRGGGYRDGGGSGQGRDGDGDDYARGRSAFSDDDDTDEDTESEESESEDSQDDVPLAQSIPGALEAQKSIQIKDRAERERRRRERQAKKHSLIKASSNTQMAATTAVDDLTKRLLKLQTQSTSEQRVPSSAAASHRRIVSPALAQQQRQQQPTLRAARSLHRPPVTTSRIPRQRHASLEESRIHHNQQGGNGTRNSQENNVSPFSRNQTVISRSRKPSISQLTPRSVSPSQANSTSQAPSRRSTSIHRRGTSNAAGVLPPQPQSSAQARFPSVEPHPSPPDAGQRRPRVSQETGRRDMSEGNPVRSRALSSVAVPGHRVLQRTRTASNAPSPPSAVPPFPMETKRHPNATQHRVFVGDMQRFNTVEIGPQTRAKDVLDLVEAQGELCGEAATQPGGWMVWELAQDFGMERPLREYELPAEVYASWNSNMRLNAFMIKKTPLAGLLARQAMPSSSPRYSGYVQWESKRGKWNKRWMELKEHSIWLSKRDDGKDETFLCSLSNFDGYYVSRMHKAPKSFIFAVKSTDNLTLFENPADYLHVFSCDERDGQRWMERILLARSYVLHKERTVLFSNSPSAVSLSSNVAAHKTASLSRQAAPLMSVNALQPPATLSTMEKQPFLPGSLLAKTPV